MFEVIGESIKSATSIKLGEIFGKDIKRYKESVTNLQYPHFFIYQVSASIEPDTRNRWKINYLINIRYRYVQDTSTITNLEEKLDAIGLQLMTEFNTIQLEKPIKVTSARYEKADGVLQFFCNVILRIMTELTEEQKMEILQLNQKLKEEDK
jgi:hypothetical protein